MVAQRNRRRAGSCGIDRPVIARGGLFYACMAEDTIKLNRRFSLSTVADGVAWLFWRSLHLGPKSVTKDRQGLAYQIATTLIVIAFFVVMLLIRR